MAVELWRAAILLVDSTLQQAISNLDQTGVQIAMVVAPDGVLVGTLTDGDIRRGLLRGLYLHSPIDSIIFRNPLVAPPMLGRAMGLQLMQANKVHQLPVVDENGRVTGLLQWDELLAPLTRANMMVIMVGGQGVRLRPHTNNCPKPMLLVGGKPILEHIIERAKAEGFRHFIFAIHYLGHVIEEYFGDGARWQVRIEYLREQFPLGTGGALGLLNPTPDAPFLVSNGDVLTEIRYGELLDFHIRHTAAATMAVRMHEWRNPFGVVHTEGVDIIGFEEKPVSRSHINAGIYAISPEALRLLAVKEHCDMPTLFSRLKEQDSRTIVYPIHEPWLDVGREDDLVLARSGEGVSS